jgi:hypothetical protein
MPVGTNRVDMNSRIVLYSSRHSMTLFTQLFAHSSPVHRVVCAQRSVPVPPCFLRCDIDIGNRVDISNANVRPLEGYRYTVK